MYTVKLVDSEELVAGLPINATWAYTANIDVKNGVNAFHGGPLRRVLMWRPEVTMSMVARVMLVVVSMASLVWHLTTYASPSVPVFSVPAVGAEATLTEHCEAAALFKPIISEPGGIGYATQYKWVERCTFREAVCFFYETGMDCVPRVK